MIFLLATKLLILKPGMSLRMVIANSIVSAKIVETRARVMTVDLT